MFQGLVLELHVVAMVHVQAEVAALGTDSHEAEGVHSGEKFCCLWLIFIVCV
jgi:hypothetical protein